MSSYKFQHSERHHPISPAQTVGGGGCLNPNPHRKMKMSDPDMDPNPLQSKRSEPVADLVLNPNPHLYDKSDPYLDSGYKPRQNGCSGSAALRPCTSSHGSPSERMSFRNSRLPAVASEYGDLRKSCLLWAILLLSPS